MDLTRRKVNPSSFFIPLLIFLSIFPNYKLLFENRLKEFLLDELPFVDFKHFKLVKFHHLRFG